MSSSKTPPIDHRQNQLVKARLSYSGGFKYPSKGAPIRITVESAEEIPTQDEILKMFGVTKPTQQAELLPFRDHMPENKVQLIDELVGNIQHKLQKIRFLRERRGFGATV